MLLILTVATTKHFHHYNNIPYSGKAWWGESLVSLLALSIWQKRVWRMNRFSQKVIIVNRNLDGFSLANQG